MSSMLNEDFAQALGNRIRDARIGRDMKQTELARRLGSSQSSVTYWEGGKRGIPLDKIPDLCAALRVTPGYLFGAEPIDAAQQVAKEYRRYRSLLKERDDEIRHLRNIIAIERMGRKS